MLKLAQTETDVYLKVSKSEFKLLAKTNAASVPENTNVSLDWIAKLNNFSTGNASSLTTAKTQITALSQTLDSLIASIGA